MRAPSPQHTQAWWESPTRKGTSKRREGQLRGRDKGEVRARHEALGQCHTEGTVGTMRLWWEQHRRKANGLSGASDATDVVWDG